MMSIFLAVHHDDLIRRCATKVAQRPLRSGTAAQLASGIPLFIAQLHRTLQAEERHQPLESLRISGTPGGDALAVSEIGVSAMQHGKQLLELGFSVDQVVHGYGDLCQAVTDLAFELDTPLAVSEWRRPTQRSRRTRHSIPCAVRWPPRLTLSPPWNSETCPFPAPPPPS